MSFNLCNEIFKKIIGSNFQKGGGDRLHRLPPAHAQCPWERVIYCDVSKHFFSNHNYLLYINNLLRSIYSKAISSLRISRNVNSHGYLCPSFRL